MSNFSLRALDYTIFACGSSDSITAQHEASSITAVYSCIVWKQGAHRTYRLLYGRMHTVLGKAVRAYLLSHFTDLWLLFPWLSNQAHVSGQWTPVFLVPCIIQQWQRQQPKRQSRRERRAGRSGSTTGH